MKFLPEVPVELKPETDIAKDAIGYKYNPDIGRRTKFGGAPDWIQGEDWPVCECGEKQTFYAQLDSIGDAYDLADCGMIYVFVCYGCFATSSVLQPG